MKGIARKDHVRDAVQDRIVEAAVHLFARQGFSGTTTRRIARMADVNEASLFRHFESKQDLFWAALQSRLERLRIGKELQSALSERAKPELVLPLIIELLVQLATYESELIRLIDIGLLELGPSAERIYRKQVAPLFEAISNYFGGCMQSGVLRGMDPSLTTMALSMTVLAHHGLYRLFGETMTCYATSDEAVCAYTDFWLAVLQPETKVDTRSAVHLSTI